MSGCSSCSDSREAPCLEGRSSTSRSCRCAPRASREAHASCLPDDARLPPPPSHHLPPTTSPPPGRAVLRGHEARRADRPERRQRLRAPRGRASTLHGRPACRPACRPSCRPACPPRLPPCRPPSCSHRAALVRVRARLGARPRLSAARSPQVSQLGVPEWREPRRGSAAHRACTYPRRTAVLQPKPMLWPTPDSPPPWLPPLTPATHGPPRRARRVRDAGDPAHAPTTDHLLRTTNVVPRTSQVTLPMLEAQ